MLAGIREITEFIKLTNLSLIMSQHFSRLFGQPYLTLLLSWKHTKEKIISLFFKKKLSQSQTSWKWKDVDNLLQYLVCIFPLPHYLITYNKQHNKYVGTNENYLKNM